MLLYILLNITLLFSQNKTMDNTTKEIMVQGKEAIIIYAFDILEEKVPSLKINPKDYEISVWVNKTKAYVEFKRRIKFIPIDSNYEYDITVDLIDKSISPFEDWSYNENESLFFVPSQQEKEKIEFIKKHAKEPIPYNGFVCSIVEEEGRYSISIKNKNSYSHFYIDKITGEESFHKKGSYFLKPKPNKPKVIKDPIKEILGLVSVKNVNKL